MAIAYYYPEGPLGPVCDYQVDDDGDLDARRRRIQDAIGDGREVTYGPVDYGDLERVMDGGIPALVSRRCKVRTLADGTKEFYDCQDDFLTPIGAPVGYPLVEPQYDWLSNSVSPWGLDDDFEPLEMSPYACSPFDPDINIIPVKMYRSDGTFVEKILTEKSSPPTFPVRSGNSTFASGSVNANFVEVNSDNLWYTNPATLAWRITQGSTEIATSVTNKGTWVQVGASNNPANGWTQFMIDYGIYPSVPLDTQEDPLIGQWQTLTTTVNFPTSGTYSIRIESDNDGYIKIINSADIAILDREIYYNNSTGVGEETISLTLAAGTYTVETRIKNRIIAGGDLKLRVIGDVAGLVGLTFRWNDNPNTAGTALSSLVIDGVTFNQTGRRGETDAILTVAAGSTDYPITINPGTGFGGKEVQFQNVGFYDLDGQDYNAELLITRVEPEPQVNNVGGFWSEEGNKYAVWVNPEQCTLPDLPQEVTYMIDIPATDTYTFTGGADDEFNVFLNDETSPVIGGVGGIFNFGTNTTPFSATRTIQAGKLKMVVQCTNGNATFVDAEGRPDGLAYSWSRNPGGWYVKICRGTSCIEPTTIVWVPSGPHNAWGDFMDTYAVYPSNNLVLKGNPQTTSYNVNIPFPGDYTLEYSVDDIGVISLDGTQIVSFAANFPTSNTYTINNLTAGPHVIEVTVTNQAASADSDDWTTNPAGIAWTLTPETSASNVAVKFLSNGDLLATGEGFASVPLTFTSNAATGARALWSIFGRSIDSGYQIASSTKIMWDDDISGGFDENASLTIVSINQIGGSNIGVTFSSDGSGIDITGAGSADVVFHFAWNDNPNTSGLAVGNLELLGTTFTQSSQTGNQTETIRVSGSTSQVSYYISGQSFVQTANAATVTKTISVNGGGEQGRVYASSSFYTQNLRTENNGQRLCLNDNGSSNTYMAFIRGCIINRANGFTESNVDLGYEDTTDTSLYFYPIVRSIAEEYTSGRFGRTGTFPNRGRPPDLRGLTGYVDYYIRLGGLLNTPVNETIFNTVKSLIATNYTNNPLGNEADLPDIVSVVYPPRCTAKIEIGTPNQGVSDEPIVASSLDLTPSIQEGNLVWSTRDATGFEYKEVGSESSGGGGSGGGSGGGY